MIFHVAVTLILEIKINEFCFLLLLFFLVEFSDDVYSVADGNHPHGSANFGPPHIRPELGGQPVYTCGIQLRLPRGKLA